MSENRSAAGREPKAARVVRIHAKHTPAGWLRQQRTNAPALLKQFFAPVTFRHIQGAYGFTQQLEAPGVYWGDGGRCWAFLHDFTPEAVTQILDDCRAAVTGRRSPHLGGGHA